MAHGDGRFTKLMAELCKTDLIILDDWGLAKFTAEQRRDLLELLDDRHGNRSTIVTSRCPSIIGMRSSAERPSAMMRSLVEIPVLPETTIERGDIVTLVGAKHHVEAAVAAVGFADRAAESTDIAFVGWGVFLGALVGALTFVIGGIPLGLSTSGGALLAGLLLGWLRTTYPAFGRTPGPALSLMNTLGLNIFIAVVGINAGPGFVAGLQEVGLSLFLWGAVATSIPMIAAVFIGHYIFKFHPAILFGACAGVRTTTAALGMIQEAAKSKVPALGYGMPYAIGNTLLTIFGLVIVFLLAPAGARCHESRPRTTLILKPADTDSKTNFRRGESSMANGIDYGEFEVLSPFEIRMS